VVGQIAPGALADLVLWKPENFGAKPEMVLKSGVIAWAQVLLLLGSDPSVRVSPPSPSFFFLDG
jgi:urease